MYVEIIQRCILVTVTVILLLITVAEKQTSLTATSKEQTLSQYMFTLIYGDGNNTIIIKANNELVQFSVQTSEPLNQTQCARGGNTVYSGEGRDSSHYLGTFCGGSWVEMFVASHNSMVIVLDNAMDDFTKMTLTYKTQKDCGGGATAGRNPRYIRTPGYPHGRVPTRFSVCAWVPVAPNDERVRISLKFATPTSSPYCDRRNVTIMDGNSLRWYRRTIGVWCGGPQRTYISWQNMMGILAKGLEHLASGLEIEFVAVPGKRCEHKINADNMTSGVITSPGYPHGYADLLECRWEIKVSRRRNIRVTVLDSDMDSSSNCAMDNVKAYTNSQANGEAVRTWCGTQKPSFEFNTYVVLLVFKAGSGYNNAHKGFKLRYEISEQPTCGGNLTAYQSRGQLSSVGYPNPFQGYQQCIWYIRASNPLKVIDLSVVSSDLYYDFPCGGERVSVYDGWTITEDNRLGTWCGSRRPAYRSQSAYMMVVFLSGRSNTRRKGFLANYGEDPNRFLIGDPDPYPVVITITDSDWVVFASDRDMCGYEKGVRSSPMWIASPGYPAHYVSGYDCFWNLTASWGAIAVRFTDLDMRCPGDSIRIYDGGLSSRHRSWTVCETGTYSYLSTSLKMYIHFQTQTNQGKGFNLTYQGYYDDVAGCGTHYKTLYFNTSRLVWRSPGYPGNYFDNLSCRWLLAGSTKVRLEIKVKGIRGQSGNNCGGDYISVHDGYDERAPVRYSKLCSDVTIESSWRQMFVKFVTDDANTGPGFTMYYQGFGDNILKKASPGNTNSGYKKKGSKGGSFQPWILVGGLTPAIVVLGIIIGVFVYVKCKYKSGSSAASSSRSRNYITDYNPSSLRRINRNRDSSNSMDTIATISNNRNTPSAPSDSDNQRSDPYAPPPSYFEIDQFPAERKSNDDPPLPLPPSYMDAVQGGMIMTNDPDQTGGLRMSTTFV